MGMNLAVYVDQARNGYGRMIMCHMVADTPQELHAMAASIGMKRQWFQAPGPRVSFPHYDVSVSRRAEAVKRGALEIDRYGIVEFMRSMRRTLIAQGQTWETSGWM